MRHPLAVILLAAAILGILLYPVGHMKVGIPEATVLPQEVRVSGRRRHPEGELRVRRTQPDGDRRHPGGRSTQRPRSLRHQRARREHQSAPKVSPASRASTRWRQRLRRTTQGE